MYEDVELSHSRAPRTPFSETGLIRRMYEFPALFLSTHKLERVILHDIC